MKFITYIRRPSLADQLLFVVQGFAHFLDGLVMIVGLGFFVPRFVLEVACLRMELHIRNEGKRLRAVMEKKKQIAP